MAQKARDRRKVMAAVEKMKEILFTIGSRACCSEKEIEANHVTEKGTETETETETKAAADTIETEKETEKEKEKGTETEIGTGTTTGIRHRIPLRDPTLRRRHIICTTTASPRCNRN